MRKNSPQRKTKLQKGKDQQIDKENQVLRGQIRNLENSLSRHNVKDPLKENQINRSQLYDNHKLDQNFSSDLNRSHNPNSGINKRLTLQQLSPEQKYQNTIDNYRNQIKHMRDYLREIEVKSITPPHKKQVVKEIQNQREKQGRDKIPAENGFQDDLEKQLKYQYEQNEIKKNQYELESLNNSRLHMKVDKQQVDEIITKKQSESEFKRDYWKRKNIGGSQDKNSTNNLNLSQTFDNTQTTVDLYSNQKQSGADSLLPHRKYSEQNIKEVQLLKRNSQDFQEKSYKNEVSQYSKVQTRPESKVTQNSNLSIKDSSIQKVDSENKFLANNNNISIYNRLTNNVSNSRLQSHYISQQNQDLLSVKSSQKHTRLQSISFAQDAQMSSPEIKLNQSDIKPSLSQKPSVKIIDIKSGRDSRQIDNSFILEELRKLKQENLELRDMMNKQQSQKQDYTSIQKHYDANQQNTMTIISHDQESYRPLRRFSQEYPIIVPSVQNERTKTFETLQSQDDHIQLLSLKPCYKQCSQYETESQKQTIDTQKHYDQQIPTPIKTYQTSLTPIDKNQRMQNSHNKRSKRKQSKNEMQYNHIMNCQDCQYCQDQIRKYQQRIDEHMGEFSVKKTKKSNRKQQDYSTIQIENTNYQGKQNNYDQQKQPSSKLRYKTPDRYARNQGQSLKKSNKRDTSSKAISMSHSGINQSKRQRGQQSNQNINQKYIQVRQKSSGHTSKVISNKNTIEQQRNQYHHQMPISQNSQPKHQQQFTFSSKINQNCLNNRDRSSNSNQNSQFYSNINQSNAYDQNRYATIQNHNSINNNSMGGGSSLRKISQVNQSNSRKLYHKY
eukprot:403335715